MSIVKRCFPLLIVFFAMSAPLVGQVENQGDVDTDTQLTTSMHSSGLVLWNITNHYSSPLVAYTFSTHCGPKRNGTGSSDAALDYASPLLPSRTTRMTSDTPECVFKVTSALFVDGRRDGDATEIQNIILRRTYALKQLKPILALVFHQSQTVGALDPSAIESTIESQKSQIEKATHENMDRITAESEVLSHLLDQTKRLEALANKPDYKTDEHLYMQILDNWSRILKNGAYPKHLVLLMFP